MDDYTKTSSYDDLQGVINEHTQKIKRIKSELRGIKGNTGHMRNRSKLRKLIKRDKRVRDITDY